MNKKILLIEDDLTVRENTTEILRLAQYNVVAASNGRDGSIMAKKIKPDLVISDILMPGLDGYGVLHILSKDPATSEIPFIFLTSKIDKTDFRKGMNLGADDYITKPFDDTDLLNAVEARLKKTASINLNNAFDLKRESNTRRGLTALSKLYDQKVISKYKKREVVYHVGDQPNYLYYLTRGLVKIYRIHDDGKEYITHIYKDGDFFGYNALLSVNSYTTSALALSDCDIYRIPYKDVMSLMSKSSDAASFFIKLLTEESSNQEQQIIRLAYDSVRKRTAEIIIKYFREANKSNYPYKISISREDLASLVGTATETVIRCLGEFKEDKYIEIKGRDIYITNIKGLESI